MHLFRLPYGNIVRIELELRNLCVSLVSPLHIPTLPHCPKYPIPNREEWLREIRLDAPALMMNVVVSGIVAANMLQRIPGQSITAVVVDGLNGAASKEAHSLTGGHAGSFISKRGSECIE